MPLCIQNRKANAMKRDDLFPSKYAKCADLKGKPRVVEIEQAPVEIAVAISQPSARATARTHTVSIAHSAAPGAVG
jgi:hypothetical protein